jgi:lipoprotein-anchoring transpeptidase ErfK/SrfK
LTFTSRARRSWLAAALAALAVAGGVVLHTTPGCDGDCAAPAAAPASQTAAAAPSPTEPAKLTVTPTSGAEHVDPSAPPVVQATSGTLTAVEMVNDAGKTIPGVLAPDATSWRPDTQLGYGRTYTMTITSRGPGGMPARQTSSFSTIDPSYLATVGLNTTGYAPIQDGGTYGVGMVIVAHFDAPIADRVAAARHMKVTTEPAVSGNWYWVDDQTAHWRPEKYYAPGTKVHVDAAIYGAELGPDLYGAEDERVSFVIGDSHVSVADDTTKQVSVYDNGRLVRTMPTSMGMGGTEDLGDHSVSFWTPPGAYTVMGKANPVIMDSSTFGLPVNSRLGYRETINWATQISTDGIYLHELETTVWAQGNTDTSHGCLNLNHDNAQWFFEFARPGDVVEVRNTGGPPLRLDQGGDWTVPWAQWRTGGAPA